VGRKRKQKKIKTEKPLSAEPLSVKKKSEKRNKKKRQQVPLKRDHPNRTLTCLAGLGMVLTAYLALTSLMGQNPLYCDAGSSCDIVQHSRWGTFLGLPTALWGFLLYALLAYIGYFIREPAGQWKSAWTVSFIGFGYSLYLNAVSMFVIEAMCAYCIVSLSIMALIFAVVSFQKPSELTGFNFRKLAVRTIVTGMVIIGGMHLHYSGLFDPAAGPEDPYLKGLAEHLSAEDAVLYGAYW
jgi:uncharacterized membrane protein